MKEIQKLLLEALVQISEGENDAAHASVDMALGIMADMQNEPAHIVITKIRGAIADFCLQDGDISGTAVIARIGGIIEKGGLFK